MQTETQIKDQILQLANNICSLLGMPVFLDISSLNNLFNDKIYYDILGHLHPNLQEHFLNLENKNTTTEKRLKALVGVLEKLLNQKLDHIKIKKIVQKDPRMTLKFIQILYQYIKKNINSRKQNVGSQEELSQQEENQSLYQRIINEEQNQNKGKKKIKKNRKQSNKAKSFNKLSQSDYAIPKQLTKGIQRMKSPSSKNYLVQRRLNEEIDRKNLQLQMKEKQLKSFQLRQMMLMSRSKQLQKINEAKKRKFQNQRQTYLKQEIERDQKSLEYKIRDQKSIYLRKLNSALLKLEKQKHVEEAKSLRDRKNQQDRQLSMEIQSIKSYYKSQMDLTKEGQYQERRNRALVDRAYKQMASKLEKQLRNDNDSKIKVLQLRSQGDLLKWQDYDKIQDTVRQIYKKHY